MIIRTIWGSLKERHAHLWCRLHTLDSLSVLMRSSLSKMLPSDSKRSFRMRSSIAFSWFLSALILTMSWFRCSSRSGRSSRTTSLVESAKHKNSDRLSLNTTQAGIDWILMCCIHGVSYKNSTSSYRARHYQWRGCQWPPEIENGHLKNTHTHKT